ncbi:MAG TPA: type I glutamate--ammonia ligase [Syntrophothermus lipocalidus]|uniref:type I glutamate--ammonia ligase n=1 Tax=Syntrophothermus sp. TaxID=2736299 RepID=UPI00180E1ED7|nr:type I glutamate--ammonia ligase [Syntrophothermus sp.]NSW83303.1 type I glutamate--ammonia ligase [Syntrophothermus sp.]HHV76860.1 type I glutamate--ammonia ligase [Syntrophothermus lipocalidus]
MTPEEISALIKDKGITFIDLKFNDLPGLWQHFSMPSSELTGVDNVAEGGLFREGVGFDGSSIRGFQQIQESDMILIPDPDTAVIDPVCKAFTLSMICDIYDPITRQPYSRDPRYVAKKAEAYLKSTGIADTSYWGPEMEFFIFDDVRFDQSVNFGYYYLDSIEGEWNTGRQENPNLGYKARYKEGYFPVPPHDSHQDLRSEMVKVLMGVGIGVEVHHHEVASGGQAEIDMRFDSLVRMADKCMMYKYVVKNVARRHNKVVTFMPKPLFQDNGSGMHTHQSLWKDGGNLFYDPKGYGLLSQLAKYYIGGLLKHAPALMAFCAPTTNSYKRLVPGFEAPVNLVYSMRNRSAAIRIPVYTDNPKSKRIEFRPPDPSCNPYLAFAAMLMAGLDGIENEIDPGDPVDKNIYELDEQEAAKIRTVPGSLEEALNALEEDHDFLLKGNVFTTDLLEVWIKYKREKEVEPIKLRPHPYEFQLYFDL